MNDEKEHERLQNLIDDVLSDELSDPDVDPEDSEESLLEDNCISFYSSLKEGLYANNTLSDLTIPNGQSLIPVYFPSTSGNKRTRFTNISFDLPTLWVTARSPNLKFRNAPPTIAFAAPKSAPKKKSKTDDEEIDDYNQKFGDKCRDTKQCAFDGAVCDDITHKCLCKPDLPVTNHIDKCGISKAREIGEKQLSEIDLASTIKSFETSESCAVKIRR
ncbi:unnamed protein product [Diabrotica balteata]|uniref:Uncharacterized protein n=1 Tax=Diabrotica balteata TaxID=107213 RepID=A0A9N9SVW7_DIABA|nr:unnamed protein product [Diabrotica balteata]